MDAGKRSSTCETECFSGSCCASIRSRICFFAPKPPPGAPRNRALVPSLFPWRLPTAMELHFATSKLQRCWRLKACMSLSEFLRSQISWCQPTAWFFKHVLLQSQKEAETWFEFRRPGLRYAFKLLTGLRGSCRHRVWGQNLKPNVHKLLDSTVEKHKLFPHIKKRGRFFYSFFFSPNFISLRRWRLRYCFGSCRKQ